MSNEQKPPHSPEQPDFPHDLRFTDERVEALRGSVGLAGDTVEITGYLGTDQSDDEVKHYIEYKDESEDTKYTTLDQFVWSHLPAERKDQLARAGMNAYDLDAGTDPILQKAQAGEAEPSEASTDLIDVLTEHVASRLTGRSRQGESSRRDPADTLSAEPAVTPENFRARVTLKTEKHDNVTDKKTEKGFTSNRETVVKKERLDKLIPIAQEIAQALRERKDKEYKRRQVEIKKAEQAGHKIPTFGLNPHEPELTVSHRWRVQSRRANFPKYGWNGTKKLKSVEFEECAEGWLLARTASILGRTTMVQEVLLGEDGKLHAYVREGRLPFAPDFFNKPHSRRQMQDSIKHKIVPTGGVVYIAAPTAKRRNFHTITSGDQYPLPGVNEHLPHQHVFADPDVIQQGLEDLVVEKGL